MNSLISLLVLPLKFYQRFISPGLSPRCKYYPSCSSYAVDALSLRGLAGIPLVLWRVLRCNPWSAGGVDYVPTHGFSSTYSQKGI